MDQWTLLSGFKINERSTETFHIQTASTSKPSHSFNVANENTIEKILTRINIDEEKVTLNLGEEFGQSNSSAKNSTQFAATSTSVIEITSEPPLPDISVKKKLGRLFKSNIVKVPTRFGQCGNQLGEEMFSCAFNDIVGTSSAYWKNVCSRDAWFRHKQKGDLRARAILVDSEMKVLSNIAEVSKKYSWGFSTSNIVSSFGEGAGNNFALGYSVVGPKIQDTVMELLRKESENCDRLSGIVSLASCSGGTGSGVGTLILENVVETFPHKNLISVLVSPYISGEVVGQNNNMLFTLSKQNDVCDALVIFENESISNSFKPPLENSSFLPINRVIAQNLLSFLQPLSSNSSGSNSFDIISELCPHPEYKFLSMKSFPLIKSKFNTFEPSPSWISIERDILRWFRSSYWLPNSDFTSSVASAVISRGNELPVSVLSKLRSALIRPDWAPANHWFYHHHQPRPLLNLEKFLSVVLNSTKICDVLDPCISKSWKLFTNNMHVHHYYKYGYTRDDFLNAFYKCEKLLKLYSSLS